MNKLQSLILFFLFSLNSYSQSSDNVLNTVPAINTSKAVEIAIQKHHAGTYNWDVDAAKYPRPELLIMDAAYPDRSGNLILAYKIDLYSLVPFQETRYYINAQSGEI